MILLDKLAQRGLQRMGKDNLQVQSPLPNYMQNINRPPVIAGSLDNKMSTMPQRGQLASMPQWGNINKRFIADLPASVQLQGIQQILSGQDTNSPIVNNFVKGMAAQGKTPEEIRQAFIANQKNSNNPLVLM